MIKGRYDAVSLRARPAGLPGTGAGAGGAAPGFEVIRVYSLGAWFDGASERRWENTPVASEAAGLGGPDSHGSSGDAGEPDCHNGSSAPEKGDSGDSRSRPEGGMPWMILVNSLGACRSPGGCGRAGASASGLKI
jgi:hypothetical protein